MSDESVKKHESVNVECSHRGINWEEMIEQHMRDVQLMRDAEMTADAVKIIFSAVYDSHGEANP